MTARITARLGFLGISGTPAEVREAMERARASGLTLAEYIKRRLAEQQQAG